MNAKIHYSGMLGAENKKNLLTSIQTTITQWSQRWFGASTEISIEDSYQNMQLFKSKKMQADKYDDLFCNHLICCRKDESSLTQVVKAFMSFNGDSNVNDKKFIESINASIESSLVDELMTFSNLFSQSNLEKQKQLQQQEPEQFNIGLSLLVTLNTFKFTIHFSDYFLHCFSFLQDTNKLHCLQQKQITESMSDAQINYNLCIKTSPITVGQLNQLEVGNVIKLAQLIKEPFIMESNIRSRTLKGFLVKSNSGKAVYLTEN